MKKVESKFLKDKKAQSQIITTVLIILLVLAAAVIVWQVVDSTVRGSAKQIEVQSDCIGTGIEIKAATLNNATVMRKTGGISDSVSYKVLVDGITVNTTNTPETIAQLETSIAVFDSALTIGTHKVQASAMIEGQACGLGTEFEVVIA